MSSRVDGRARKRGIAALATVAVAAVVAGLPVTAADAAASWAGVGAPAAASWAGVRGPAAASWAGVRGPAAASWAGVAAPAAASWAGVRGPAAASWAGVAAPAAASWAGVGHQVRMVVALSSRHAVTVPGVRLITALPGVHAEVVQGSAAALERLSRAHGVLGEMADQSMHLDGAAFDPTGDSVYAPESLGARAGHGWSGHGVTIALIDTGVSDTPALNRASGRLVDAVDTSPLVDLQQPVTSGTFSDGYGHGTFLASLIAGGAADGRHGPVVGVAPGATVDVVKVAKSDGSTSLAAVLAGMNWVALHAGSVRVANVALGLPTQGGWGIDPLSLATELLRQSGVSVVVAAGNTPGQVSDPGFDPKAITVGAADLTNGASQVASFSGSADVAGVTKPDVVAAGVGVLGVLPAGSVIAQQYPNAQQPNGLWRGSGTSEATAIASGDLALFYASHPHATTAVAKASLRASTVAIAGTGAGAGLIGVPTRATDGSQPGDHGTGEEGYNPLLYMTSDWAKASFRATDWAAASWAKAASWAGANWDAASWAGDWWSAASWAAASWAGNNWQAASWAAASWAAASWAAASWADESWGD